MSLAVKIEEIERFGELSRQTKDTAQREIVDNYRREIVEIDNLMRNEFSDYHPAIEKVIAGETTFMAEFKKLGAYKFLIQGNMEITGGNFDMIPQIEIVDRTIQRLYREKH